MEFHEAGSKIYNIVLICLMRYLNEKKKYGQMHTVYFIKRKPSQICYLGACTWVTMNRRVPMRRDRALGLGEMGGPSKHVPYLNFLTFWYDVILRHHYWVPDWERRAKTNEGDQALISYWRIGLRGMSLISSKRTRRGAKVHPFVHIH